MRPFTDDDFPLVASGHNVYRRTESSPICTCPEQEMAAELARRLNRENQVCGELDQSAHIARELLRLQSPVPDATSLQTEPQSSPDP